jgi:hypothetical protein
MERVPGGKMVKRFGIACGAFLAVSLSGELGRPAEIPLPPVPTTVVVRVVGNHALVLGDAVGGADVTIKDAETGGILASGRQTGPSGDLRTIMQTPHTQTEPIYSLRTSASFTAELRLTKPTLVEITGEGPLNFPQAKRRASKTVLLYPGKHVTGDGIVLELNGLIVQIEAPPKDQPLGVGDSGTIRATVRMLCDCIVEPFGNWDSRKMDLYGEMWVGNRVILKKIDLFHQGPKGLFLGNFIIPRSLQAQGHLTLRVVAADAEGLNVGYDEVTYPLVPFEQSRDATGREIPPIGR